MRVDETEPARGVAGGLVCGLVTVVALGLVFGQLGEYQVPDYADRDSTIGLVGAFFGALGAAAVIAMFKLLPWGGRLSVAHVLVPLVMLPAVLVPLVWGLERNNLEALLIWGAAAAGVHASIGTRRPATGIALVLVVAALLTAVCQHRWRAQKFEAVGLPLYLAQVPGYTVSGTWAGRYTVSMALRPADRDHIQFVDAVIRANPRCRDGNADRWIIERDNRPNALGICLAGGDGASMTVAPGYQAPDLAPLFERITVRKVDGSVLADYRNGGETEPD